MKSIAILIAILITFTATAHAEPHRYYGKGGKAGTFGIQGRTVSAEEYKANMKKGLEERLKLIDNPKAGLYKNVDGKVVEATPEEWRKNETEIYDKRIKEIDATIRDHKIEMHKEIKKFKRGKRKDNPEFKKLRKAYEAERKANGELSKEMKDEAEQRTKLDKKIEKMKNLQKRNKWLNFSEQEELEKLELEVEAELKEE